MNTQNTRKRLGRIIFEMRWILYPINIGLLVALAGYVLAFLYNDYRFVRYDFTWDMEALMLLLLSFVDASMVANLIVMIIQGSHQIFIHKFELPDTTERPQYLDHIDTGILKVKVSLSIASITLIQILKDFVHLEEVDWSVARHRMMIHGMVLVSSFAMALIWRITHPQYMHEHPKNEKDHVHH